MSAIKLRLKNDFSVKAAYLARRDASVSSPCLMVLENDYLNAICNLFTMPEWEGSGGKTIWCWSEMGSVAKAGDTSEGRLVREVRPGCFWWKIKKRSCCRWLPQPEWILSSFSCPPRTQITQHSASQCHTFIVCVFVPSGFLKASAAARWLLSALWDRTWSKIPPQCFL